MHVVKKFAIVWLLLSVGLFVTESKLFYPPGRIHLSTHLSGTCEFT
jgi:hypothetical protein